MYIDPENCETMPFRQKGNFSTFEEFSNCVILIKIYNVYHAVMFVLKNGVGSMSIYEMYSQEWIYDRIVNNPDFCIMLTDDQSHLIYVNDTYLRIMGFSREEIIGKHIDDITPLGKTPKILASGKAQVGYLFRVNGVDTIAASYPIIQDGRTVGVFGTSMFLDIANAQAFSTKLKGLLNNSSVVQNRLSHEYHRQVFAFESIVGQSPVVTDLIKLAAVISKADGTVLITGESGTGKDLLAKALHASSPREQGPFVRLNCAAIPENLLESELFGYDEGTFTGGLKGGKRGKFEIADTGTIFLDEIAELPLGMQAKLLNVLQEREIEPLGSIQKFPKKINVRVIAATNKNLEDMIEAGSFRQDLYYRLNVSKLDIPPLRERKDDIPLLSKYIIDKIKSRTQSSASAISPEVEKIFRKFDWPGNVRQLENVIERALIRANLDNSVSIELKHISEVMNILSKQGDKLESRKTTDLKEFIHNAEKHLIVDVLHRSGGDKAAAADMLGIHISALYKKLSKYDIR